MPIYNKLVRDLIPEHLDELGISYHIETLDEESYKVALLEKMKEEIKELIEAPPESQLEELADLVEVALALANTLGGRKVLEAARNEKNEKRGAFEKRIFLLETSA
jgi:predicted house-cleaning noncanonical NTP pyrophosphatase (MazG superfamily)